MDKNRIIDICAKIALTLAVVCSTAYLLMLGWYNSLLLDDYGFVAEVDQSGAYGLMKSAYWHWQSRFSAFYILGWILKIWGHASNLIGYTILLLTIGYATIYFALRRIAKVQNRWMALGLAIVINNVSIMAYLEMSTFYWVCCALYTLSPYVAILLFTIIFFSEGKGWLRWLSILFCSMYLCGGAENFTPIVIATLGCILLYQMIAQRTWRFWQTKEQKMMLFSMLILCAGFIAVVLGPGSNGRATNAESNGFMGHFALVPYSVRLAKATAIFSMRLMSRSLYYILLIPIGIIIGQQMRETADIGNVRKKVLLAFVIASGIILLSIAAPVFGMGWYSPLRSYCFVSFVVAVWFVYVGAMIGSRLSPMVIDSLMTLSSCVIVAYSLYYCRQEQPLAKDYREQIVKLNTTIQDQIKEGRTEPLVLQPITHPIIPNTYAIFRTTLNRCLGKKTSITGQPITYFPYEQFTLSKDPVDWKNKDIQRYYNAQFDIVGWNN